MTYCAASLADLPPASLSPVGAGGTQAVEPLRGRLGAHVPCLRALAVVAVRRRHARRGTT